LARELETAIRDLTKASSQHIKAETEEEVRHCEIWRALEEDNRKLKEEKIELQKQVEDLGFCASELIEVRIQIANINRRRSIGEIEAEVTHSYGPSNSKIMVDGP